MANDHYAGRGHANGKTLLSKPDPQPCQRFKRMKITPAFLKLLPKYAKCQAVISFLSGSQKCACGCAIIGTEISRACLIHLMTPCAIFYSVFSFSESINRLTVPDRLWYASVHQVVSSSLAVT